MQLRIFYDSYCPLCVAEMRQLKRYDTQQQLELQDIHARDFGQRFPQIDPKAANRILHAEGADGELYLGLDASYAAWALVGKHRWLKVLRMMPIKLVADWVYLRFAKHRYTISYWLTGKKRCENGFCHK